MIYMVDCCVLCCGKALNSNKPATKLVTGTGIRQRHPGICLPQRHKAPHTTTHVLVSLAAVLRPEHSALLLPSQILCCSMRGFDMVKRGLFGNINRARFGRLGGVSHDGLHPC